MRACRERREEWLRNVRRRVAETAKISDTSVEKAMEVDLQASTAAEFVMNGGMEVEGPQDDDEPDQQSGEKRPRDPDDLSDSELRGRLRSELPQPHLDDMDDDYHDPLAASSSGPALLSSSSEVPFQTSAVCVIEGECARVVLDGPPWFDTVLGTPLDEQQTKQGMDDELKSWENLGVKQNATWQDARATQIAEIIRSGWVLRD